MKEKEPYLLVSVAALNRLKEIQHNLNDTVDELKGEVYSESQLAEDNRHLQQQMDLRCDEKLDLYKEISRLQLLLDDNGINYQIEDEDE